MHVIPKITECEIRVENAANERWSAIYTFR